MLDIRLIRTEPDRVKAELAKVGFPAFQVDALLDADRRRREALHAVEQLRAGDGRAAVVQSWRGVPSTSAAVAVLRMDR